jgi:hypothetical protein
LNLNNSEIVEELTKMDRDSKAIKQNLLQMCWYMRGGLTYFEALHTSSHEHKLVMDIIKENLETTKKTGLNFF